ncbi:MAG: response regulator [Armatimonadetes bacterium]|nr:response regulator [Armatimonadota bacterium]
MSNAHILIVDDEENIRETMRFALEAVGHRVETAASGAEALEEFGSGEGWDLVLLDQRMPGVEGLEVLRRIRERDPAARVIMVTAYGTIELAVEAMKAGARDFLRKPFTPDTLRGAAQAALAQPRTAVATEEFSLTRLLPPELFPAGRELDVPYISFRTLNGYHFWPVPLPPGGQETEALRVRRAFEVKAPGGEIRRCTVDITASVRGLVRERTGQDFPPEHAIWDTLCRMSLSDYLWEQAEFPPDNLLVDGLTRSQWETVRAMAGLGPTRIW